MKASGFNDTLLQEYSFDGLSIGFNGLTQLVLGADRDTEEIFHFFDVRNAAVKQQIRQLIQAIDYSGKLQKAHSRD